MKQRNYNYLAVYEWWLHDPNMPDMYKGELEWLKYRDEDKKYRFSTDLEFGTAGMRGLIGIGTNMMNTVTVMRATQGLVEYAELLGLDAPERGIVIAYDTRQCSRLFAKKAAEVIAANRMNVYLYEDVRPVPMLSHAIRRLNAVAGIMITASHNPKEYNGYKVYGEDGAQLSPEATECVVRNIDAIRDYTSVKGTPKGFRHLAVPDFVDEDYYKAIKSLSLSPDAVAACGEKLKLVYTPVHGSGYKPVMRILGDLGIHVTVVEEQTTQDPFFSTVEVPNPEYKETLTMGIELAKKIDADVVFGTDPDCDRLGVAVRKGEGGEFDVLSGNQVGVLLLDYILTRLKEENALPGNAAVVKSFVSTNLAKLICEDFGVTLVETPVGFKFIGEKIKEWEKDGSHTFVFGFEESCGYLRGTHARDKDAVVASMLCAEMVCYYTYIGKTLYGRLQEIYEKYGFVLDRNVSVKYEGVDAMQQMNAVVNALKGEQVEKLGDYPVQAIRDYSNAIRTLPGGWQERMDAPKTNCIYYELGGGAFACVRPSGTEPKMKIYYSIRGKDEAEAEASFEKVKADMEKVLASVK